MQPKRKAPDMKPSAATDVRSAGGCMLGAEDGGGIMGTKEAALKEEDRVIVNSVGP